MYKNLNRERQGDKIRKLWSDVWSIKKEHSQHAERLKDCVKQFDNAISMDKVEISKEVVKMQCRKMPNWKAPVNYGVHGYWLKNLISLHPHKAV